MENELKVGHLFRLKKALDQFFPIPGNEQLVQAAWSDLRMACADLLDAELAPTS